MKKIVCLLCLCLLLVFTQVAGYAADLKLVKKFKGGKLYKADNFNVLVLKGSYRQMGRQYGALMKDDLKKFYAVAIDDLFIKKYHRDYEWLKKEAYKIVDLYPERFKEILRGMEETSGLTMDKLVMLDQVYVLTFVGGLPYCTGMAAWGEYTGGGPLVFARNFDMGPLYKDFGEFLTMVVYNPDDGSVPTASLIGHCGMVSTVNCMNKEGLLIENNEGVISGGVVFYDNRMPTPIRNLAFLLDSSTMKQLDAMINGSRMVSSIIMNVADKNNAYSYECPVFDIKRRSGDHEGLLVATNHFIEPSWGISPPMFDPSDRTLRRRSNLLAAGKKYKGSFNPKTMMKLFDTTIDNGGPTWPLETHHTIFQFVAVPAELKVWLKAPGYADWTEIELGKLFSED